MVFEIDSSEDFVAQESFLIGDAQDSLHTSLVNSDSLGFKLFYTKIFHTKRARYCNVDLIDASHDSSQTLYQLNFPEIRGVGASLPQEMIITAEQARICSHHLTFECILKGHQETSFQEIYDEVLVDGTSRMTPDYHVSLNGVMYIVEFATCASVNRRILENTFTTKLCKYLDTMNTMASKTGIKSRLCVIVVGREGVVSSVKLENGLISELIFRYRTSFLAVDELRMFGVIPAQEEDDSERETVLKLEEMFSSIEFDFDSKGEWTRENYENWIAPLSEEEEQNVYKNVTMAIQKSQVKVDSEIELRARESLELRSEAQSKIRVFHENMRKRGNTRLDLKGVSIFPLVIPKGREVFLSLNFKNMDINLSGNNVTELAWISAVSSAKTSDTYEFEEDVTDLYKKAFLSEDKNTLGRSSYKRVEISLSDSEWVELAKKGVEAKRFSTEEEIITSMQHSKLGFDPSVNTDDIENFVNSSDLFKTRTTLPGYMKTYHKLIKRAGDLSESTGSKYYDAIEKMVRNFESTNFFNYNCFISELACELLMSLRQNCTKGQFVLKSMKFRDVLVLIKPTNSSGHLFFSLLWIDDGSSLFIGNLPFTIVNKDGNVYYTNFVSANPQQLSHWATAASNSIMLLMCWSKYYQINIIEESDKDFSEYPIDFTKMMNISLLIFLEQKTSTEEVCTLFRYLSMECFKDTPGFCDTLKILNKMPGMNRSRLTVWVTKKLLTEATRLYGKGYKLYSRKIKDSTRVRSAWSNILNPYTEEKIEDPACLVNLYYIGYLRNKHTRTSNNQDMALISKIVKSELQYWDSKDKETLGSCKYSLENKHNPHNYDVGFMKMISNKIKKELHYRAGSSDPEVIAKRYLKHLSYQSPDAFMTLKASSSFKPGDEELLLGSVKSKLDEIKRLNKCLSHHNAESDHKEELEEIKKLAEKEVDGYLKPKARPRVVEEFCDIVCDYQPPSLYLKESLKICKEHGLMIDIFKKPQQGGLREIYVITRESRMIQYCVENLSRILCGEFESEIMTHPRNKVNLMTNHGQIVRAKSEKAKEAQPAGHYVYNSFSSKDKKSWNNTNSPSKFAIILLRLLPKRLHPFIFNSLKLWDKKNMLLPEGIRQVINKGKKWDIGDEVMNSFIDSYFQKDSRFDNIIHDQKPYITIKTGMMQGILHFTSSLTHTGFNLLMCTMFKCMANKQKWIYDHLFTHLESSDDSAYLKTIIIDPRHKEESARFQYTFELFTTEMSKLAGFHESFEKSSHHSSRVVEFNSEFCFDNQVNKPDMKFAFSSLRIPENESLSETCYQYKCLSSACLESGTNILGVHILQRAQALMHYTTMGLTLNPFFKEFAHCLRMNTDPGTGFFPLDPCMLAGIIDHQFNVWMCMKGNPVLAAKTAVLLSTEKISSMSTGTVLKSGILQFGDRRRWAGIVSRIEDKIGAFDYRKHVSEHPQLLFTRPKSKEDLIAYHFLKLFTPSIISSLGNVGRLDKMIIRGGYMFQFKCLTVGSLWETLIDKKTRMSLFNLCIESLKMSITKLKVLKSYTGLDDEEELLLSKSEQYLSVLENEAERSSYIESLENFLVTERNLINDKILTLSDQKKLFPQHHEYLTILTNHRSLRNSGNQNWHSLEKKRAIVNVYTAPLRDLMSLESVAITKWFNIDSHRFSKSLINTNWEKYKCRYDWLRDSFAESFELSNFENEISFANFIKGQNGKNRNLYVTTAPLKIEDGHSALYSLMTRHSWPGILLRSRAKREILNKTSRDVFHAFSTLCGAEITNDYKVEIITDICQKEGPYRDSVINFLTENATSVRELKLRPILRFLRNEKPASICSELITSKLGVIGSWVKPERYDNNTRTYRGTGLWVGRIDSLIVSIDTMDSAIRKINVNSAFEVRNSFNILKEWMKEVHLTFSDSLFVRNDQLVNLVGIVKNGVFSDSPTTDLCTPIFETKSLTFSPHMGGYKDFYVKFTPISVQLRASMRRTMDTSRFAHHQDVTVISVRLYDSDVLTEPFDFGTKDRIINLILSNCRLGDKIESRSKTTMDTRSVGFSIADPETKDTVYSFKEFFDRVADDNINGDSLVSKLISNHKLSYDEIKVADGFSVDILRRLLPAQMYVSDGGSTLEGFRRTLKEVLTNYKRAPSVNVPKELDDLGASTWEDVILKMDAFNVEQLMLITTALSSHPILFCVKKGLFWRLNIIHHTKLPDATLDEVFLTSCKIIVQWKDNSLTKTVLLTKMAPRIVSHFSRMVKTVSPVNPANYNWKEIITDLRLLKMIVTDKGPQSKHYNPGFKSQLRRWLCRSMNGQGIMNATTMEQINEYDPSKSLDELIKEAKGIREEMNDHEVEAITAYDEMGDTSFDDFLNSEEGCDLTSMLTNQAPTDADELASTTSSLDITHCKEDEIMELFKIRTGLESYGNVKCAKLKLFDSLAAKLVADFNGFFATPGTNIVRRAVDERIYNIVNFFLEGSLVMEEYHIPDDAFDE